MKVSAAHTVYCLPEAKEDGQHRDTIRSAGPLGLEVQEGFLVVTVNDKPVRLVPLAQVIWIEP